LFQVSFSLLLKLWIECAFIEVVGHLMCFNR
jgi:hypothetical protein